jgi:hypothetical protein
MTRPTECFADLCGAPGIYRRQTATQRRCFLGKPRQGNTAKSLGARRKAKQTRKVVFVAILGKNTCNNPSYPASVYCGESRLWPKSMLLLISFDKPAGAEKTL